MKEQIFLKKLNREGNLKMVERSEEMKEAYLKKSESNLDSAKILLAQDKLEEGVGLIYYSMYNSLRALLFKVGIKCENHSASIILLKEIFEIDNSKIDSAKRERIDKQYYTDFSVSRKEVEEMVLSSEEFNSMILNFLDRLNNEEVEKFRGKFGELLDD